MIKEFKKNVPKELMQWYEKICNEEEMYECISPPISSENLLKIIKNKKMEEVYRICDSKKSLIKDSKVNIYRQLIKVIFYVEICSKTSYEKCEERLEKTHKIDNDLKNNITELKKNIELRIKITPKLFYDDQIKYSETLKYIDLIHDFLINKEDEKSYHHVEKGNQKTPKGNKKRSKLKKVTDAIFYSLENEYQKNISHLGIEVIVLILEIFMVKSINLDTVITYYKEYKKNTNNKINLINHSMNLDSEID